MKEVKVRLTLQFGKGLALRGEVLHGGAKAQQGEVWQSFAKAGRSTAKAKVKTGNNIAERKQNDNKRNTTKKNS